MNRSLKPYKFQHTAARGRLATCRPQHRAFKPVSTHSRPRAAGDFLPFFISYRLFQHTAARGRLASSNSKPSRGQKTFQHTAARGRLAGSCFFHWQRMGFQHTAARGRLAFSALASASSRKFQHTAARGRLEQLDNCFLRHCLVSTHSRPRAAGRIVNKSGDTATVSTHSRPRAAGAGERAEEQGEDVSTHSRPRAAG